MLEALLDLERSSKSPVPTSLEPSFRSDSVGSNVFGQSPKTSLDQIFGDPFEYYIMSYLTISDLINLRLTNSYFLFLDIKTVLIKEINKKFLELCRV